MFWWDNLEFQCSKCGGKETNWEMHENRPDHPFVCGCGGFMVIADSLPAVSVAWGNPIRKGGDRKGYHPEYDDSVSEIRADMECLKEKQMHTTDSKADRKLRKTIYKFENAIYPEVLKR